MRKQLEWLHEHGVQGKHEDVVIRRENAVDIAKKQLQDSKGRPRFADPNDRRVIYASPLVDVAGNMELVRETVEICKLILTLTHWQIRLLSKFSLLPKVAQMLDEWDDVEMTPMQLRARHRIIYGLSTGTLDDKLTAAFEQGTSLVSKRIQALHQLQDSGYRTFGMVCPSLPQSNYNEFARNMCAALRYDRMEEVWAEVINLRGESFTRTYDALADAGRMEAQWIKSVSEDKSEWERYARETFLAHTDYCPAKKLRFLQYVNNGNRSWWESAEEMGAVLL
jgi:hypothetical protein